MLPFLLYFWSNKCNLSEHLRLHLADAFIQSDFQVLYVLYLCSLGIEPTTFCAANVILYHWATGTLKAKATEC